MTDVSPVLGSDVAACDREPIHVPGSIQPHGCLLAVEPASMVVRIVSRNVRDWFGRDAGDLCGRRLAEWVSESTADDIRAAADDPALDGGAAILHDDRCVLLGETPPEPAVRDSADWLSANVSEDVFHTDSLAGFYPAAEAFKGTASGLLAVSISRTNKDFILWFRPEVVRTVTWGGDPRKPTDPENGGHRPDPWKSFEAWKETVKLKSIAWREAEIETAAEFRKMVLGIVLKKAEEMAGLTQELERTNKELEAFTYSVSHDLRAPFRHIVGYAELLREMKADALDADGRRYVDTIIESASYAGKLVDNLLSFSHMSRTSLTFVPIDMNRLEAEVRADVMAAAGDRRVAWTVTALPVVHGDVMMLKLAVRNLLANAIKYTGGRDEATIDIGCDTRGDELIFHVRDNGAGFDMQYVDKLFGVFQRLHRAEEFEGTGIGLANVRRIIGRHGGRTWAEGAVGQGAAFFFSMPQRNSL